MRNILIYFAIKYNGDYTKILDAIKKKEQVDLEEIEKIKKQGVKAITVLDDNYPSYLKEIYAPPFVLFYEGDVSLLYQKPRLSVVGARQATNYGKEALIKILDEVLLHDVVIVSGLAEGIDSIAHKEALKHNKKTIAVLGTGIDVCYPKSNISLFNEIKQFGLLLSEYPSSNMGNPNNFPMRNRIISALGDALLVADAKFKSGTQITVRYALEQGKDIFSIPHSIFEESFCNLLIKEGAKPIFNGNDIIEEIF